MALTSAEAQVSIVPTMRGFQQKVSAGVRATKVDPLQIQVNLDRKSLAKAEAEARAASDRIGKARAGEQTATERVRLAEARLAEARKDSAAGSSAMIAAENRLAQAKRQSVAASTSVARASADEARAIAKVEEATKRLNQSLGRGTRGLKIDVDTRKLTSALTSSRNLRQELLATAKAGAILSAALAGVGVGGAAIAALPGVLAAASSGIGVLVGSFSGVGEALKGYTADQDAAAKAGAKAAKAVGSNARQIRDAESGIADARRTAAETAVSGSRAVRNAQESVSQAKVRAADAEQQYRDAVKEATLAIRDQKVELKSSSLSVEEAQLSYDQAVERMKKLSAEGASALDMRDADLGIKRAAISLEEAKNRYTDVKRESAEASVFGVKGAANVVAAQRGVQDANAGVASAERDLREAREDAAKANQDAQRGVAEAVQRLADVQAQQSEAAATAAASSSKFADAMRKLTPEARDLVNQLISMKPALSGLKQAAGEKFLPGVVQMLKDSTGLLPILEGNLRRTGAIMGDTARDFGSLFKSGEFQANLQAMFRNAEPITRAIGDLFVGVTGDIVEMGARTGATQRGFADFIGSIRRGVSEFLAVLSTPEADKAFGDLWRELGRLIEVLLPIIADLAVWVAQKLVPAISALSGWLTRNRDDLKYYAWAILGVVAAVKAINIAVKVQKWCAGIAEGISWIKRDADKAAASVDGKKGLTGKLQALKTIGAIAVPVLLIWSLQEIGSALKEWDERNQIDPKTGKPVTPEQRTIGQAGSNVLGGVANQFNENPLSSLVPKEGDTFFTWFFGKTPDEMSESIKNSLFSKLNEKFNGTVGKWMDENFAFPIQNFFINLPKNLRNSVDGFRALIGLKFAEAKDSAVAQITGARDGVVTRFTELKDGAIGRATEAKDWVVTRFTELKDGAIGRATEAKDWVVTRFRELKDGAIARATEAKDWVVTRFTELKDGAIGRATEAKDWVVTRFRELKDGAIARATEAKDWVVTRFRELKDGAIARITEAKDWVVTRFRELKDGAIARATEAKDWVVTRFRELKDGAIARITEAKDWVITRFRELKDGAIARATEAKDWVVTRFTELKDGAIRKVTEAKDWIITRATELKDGFVGRITDLVDSVGRKWDELKGFFAKPIKWVIDEVWNGTIANLWGKARTLIPSLPEFQRLATGGSVRGAGTGTSDSIPALLSNGEHVITAREVSAAGGHGAVEQWRQGLLSRNPAQFAMGGPVKVDELRDTVLRQFPTARMSSGFRQGDPGEHGAGLAADFTGPMMGINRWIAQMFPDSHELIYTPGVNLFNGRPHRYNAATQAEHNDHVHWARAEKNKGILGRLGDLVGSGYNWIKDQIAGLYDSATNPIRGLVGSLFPGDTLANRIPRDGTNMLLDGVRDRLFGEADMFGGDSFADGGPTTGDMLGNARVIANVGRALGFGRNGVVVALMTALQESGLRNINYGDRDSVGLFQQRPSQGWGSVGQIMNPSYSASKFFNALRGVRGWEGMPKTVAAQRVQRSAFPNAYAKWEGRANSLASQVGFAMGGMIPGRPNGRDDKLALVSSGEAVLTPPQWGIAESAIREVRAMRDVRVAGSGGDRSVVTTFTGDFNEPADLDSAMSRVAFLASGV